MITAPILLVIHMHIGPTSLLKDGGPNAKFDADGRLRTGFTGLAWDDNAKIEKAITVDKNDEDEEEDSWEKNRQLKREKQRWEVSDQRKNSSEQSKNSPISRPRCQQ